MSKYKAGDKVTCEHILDEIDANYLNNGSAPHFSVVKIIAHERAPEPIVMYFNFYPFGQIKRCTNLEEAKYRIKYDAIGIIKITKIGNDFTVEKVG